MVAAARLVRPGGFSYHATIEDAAIIPCAGYLTHPPGSDVLIWPKSSIIRRNRLLMAYSVCLVPPLRRSISTQSSPQSGEFHVENRLALGG